jgi:hypothetical protein
MSNVFDAAFTTLPLLTTSTIKATGATTLVAAPGAGKSICVFMVGGNNQTNSTGYAELALQEGAGGTLRFREYNNSLGTHFMDRNFLETPWILDTNTAFLVVASVTAASSPGAEITVQYRIIDRTR